MKNPNKKPPARSATLQPLTDDTLADAQGGIILAAAAGFAVGYGIAKFGEKQGWWECY